MMRTAIVSCLVLIVAYLVFQAVHKPTPAAIPEVPAAQYNWSELYQNLRDPEMEVVIRVGVTSHPASNRYYLFLVDGDKWYEVASGVLRGCGPTQDVYYFMATGYPLNREIRDVPGPRSYFKLVGPGEPKLVELVFEYRAVKEKP